MARLRVFLAWLMVGVVALALRLSDVSTRPFHTDEATNAFLLQELVQGRYQYRSHDHHGPALYYGAAAFVLPQGKSRLAQWSEQDLRWISVATGVLLALSPWTLRRHLGALGAWSAGLLIAVCAPFVYYSGIFIHETFLLLTLAGFVWAFWQTRLTGQFRWALAAGLWAGLALSLKETGALMLILFTAIALPGAAPTPFKRGALALAAGATALVLVMAFYSGFGRELEQAFALFQATGKHVSRGTGAEHAYPFYQYLQWYLAPSPVGFPWSGWLLLVGSLGGAALGWRNAYVQRVSLWLLALVLFFFLLPYKTPWLALIGLLASAWLTGFALEKLVPRARWVASGGGLVALGLLLWETDLRTRRHAVDLGNPLAYSPSSPDLRRLEAELQQVMPTASDREKQIIQVVARDYWPLPWVLRRFPQTGYWTESTPLYPEAFALLGPEVAASLAPSAADLPAFALRPGVFIFLKRPQP